MKKALIVVEPKLEFRFGVLRKLSHVRNFLEVKVWCSPLVKKLAKNYDVAIVPMGGVFDKKLAVHRKVCLIEKTACEVSSEYALQQAIGFSREWHLYRELPKLLQINSVNVGQLLQHMIMGQFFLLFRDIDYAGSLLKSESPDSVYIQSDIFPFERAFYVSAHTSTGCSFFEPRFYRALKKRLLLYLLHKGFKKSNFISSLGLYSINGGQDDGFNYSILVDTPYINDFNSVLPVIQELMNRGISTCYIFGDKLILSRKLSNLKVIKVKNENTHEHKGESRELRKYYHSKLKKDDNFQAMFAYKDVNFWDAVKDNFSLLFDKVVSDVMNSIDCFDRIIHTVNPDILIVGDDRATRVRGHVLLAKQRGIPVLEIQHGLWTTAFPMDTPLSDKIAAGGEYYKEIYMKFGAQEEQIVVTGWPKFDVDTKLKDSSLEKNRDTQDILFATHPINVKFNFDIIEVIGSFIKDSPNLRLIVKPHPAENTKIYSQLARGYQQVILKDSRENIAKLLASSDVVIIMTSTVGIEAALLDKPIVCITTGTERQNSLYISSRVAVEVKSLEELIPAIKDTLYNEEVKVRLAKARKKFVYEHAYIQDGKASKRVANLIMKMIEESKREKK